jgi:hypothetical protein
VVQIFNRCPVTSRTAVSAGAARCGSTRPTAAGSARSSRFPGSSRPPPPAGSQTSRLPAACTISRVCSVPRPGSHPIPAVIEEPGPAAVRGIGLEGRADQAVNGPIEAVAQIGRRQVHVDRQVGGEGQHHRSSPEQPVCLNTLSPSAVGTSGSRAGTPQSGAVGQDDPQSGFPGRSLRWADSDRSEMRAIHFWLGSAPRESRSGPGAGHDWNTQSTEPQGQRRSADPLVPTEIRRSAHPIPKPRQPLTPLISRPLRTKPPRHRCSPEPEPGAKPRHRSGYAGRSRVVGDCA